MAEVIIPDGFGMATLRWSMLGKTNVITSTCGYGTPTPGSDPADHADAIYEYATDTGSIADPTYSGTKWTFLGVDVHYNDGGDIVGASSSGPSLTGEISPFNDLVVNCSLLVQKKTPFIGRWARGRFYLPPTMVTEGLTDAMGNIDPSLFDQIASQVSVFSTGFCGSAVAKACVLHTEVGRAPTYITQFIPKSKVATQRRRLRS